MWWLWLILEKAMAPQSSTLTWKIPWTEEPGRLQSMGSLRVGPTERLHFPFSLSCIGEGNGNPLQCSCLENPRDRKAWWAAVLEVHRVGHNWSTLAAARWILKETQIFRSYNLYALILHLIDGFVQLLKLYLRSCDANTLLCWNMLQKNAFVLVTVSNSHLCLSLYFHSTANKINTYLLHQWSKK